MESTRTHCNASASTQHVRLAAWYVFSSLVYDYLVCSSSLFLFMIIRFVLLAPFPADQRNLNPKL